MRILVYARTDDLDPLVEAVRDDHPDAAVLPRNAAAHVEGQLEACDLCVVENSFPQVAADYEGKAEVQVVSAQGRSAELAEEPDVPEPAEAPEWDLQMDPETYLKRFPDGPNAGAAKQILGVD